MASVDQVLFAQPLQYGTQVVTFNAARTFAVGPMLGLDLGWRARCGVGGAGRDAAAR